MHANAEVSAPEKPANSASLTVNPTSERQSASLMSMSQRAMASWRKEANEKMYSQKRLQAMAGELQKLRPTVKTSSVKQTGRKKRASASSSSKAMTHYSA